MRIGGDEEVGRRANIAIDAFLNTGECRIKMPKFGVTREMINGMRPHRSQHSVQSIRIQEIASPKPDRFQILEPTQVAI